MSHIEDHALLGDGRSAALVGLDGSVDWLCWPAFDSDTCFAALLGTSDAGRWRIAPDVPVESIRRRYRDGTMTLETELATEQGRSLLVELMPWETEGGSLIRRVECLDGEMKLRFELQPRFDYGRSRPGIRRVDRLWQLMMGPVVLWLQGAHDLDMNDAGDALCGTFTLRAGECRDFALHVAPAYDPEPRCFDVAAEIRRSDAFWKRWSARHAVDGRYAEAMLRSLLTLKALTDRVTGGMVAAPTSSLPECPGGGRNWDYRYSWLRDASFTLLAFAQTGFRDEASAWRDWLMRCIAGHPSQLQIMYALDGHRRIDEWECPWLPGYADSSPVRFGNGAAKQVQIDVYGEVINALYEARRHGLPPERDVWAMECGLVEHLAKTWREPGHGIWEMRGSQRVFTLSRVMAWVALDRAARSAEEFGHDAPVDEWRRLAQTVRRDVLEHGFDAGLGTFTQCYGNRTLDASLLLLPIYGFLPADDPRMAATVDAIERQLSDGGLLKRYRVEEAGDGMEDEEGAFLACSFWLAHVRHLQGRREEARELLERLLDLRNDVGLLAEEYDVPAGRQCGNFPQALSHVALVNTVLAMDADGRSADSRQTS
jgi:GH15 family glucan-1,4-alpha-glucosidase